MAVDDNTSFTDLRDAYKALEKQSKADQAELGTLRESNRSAVLSEVGFDGDRAEGLLKLHGDGEFTADALKATAAKYGLAAAETGEPPPQEGKLPDATTTRMEGAGRLAPLAAGGTTGTSTRMSYPDFQKLRMTNPRQAMEALRDKQVELPSEMQAQLDSNRAEVRLGGVT